MEDNKTKSRIVYTEPNFVNGVTSNKNDLSVPLGDLCVGVDLIAEVKNRFTQSVNSATVVQWIAGENNISFFDGVKLDKNSDNTYLTSYFTDITFEDSKGGKIIEGLGISSIDINFDSWFTPMVSIKFIDVRGSSMLVPNQYNSEVDSSKYVTSDKLYKCFFTFPYPKFRLLVKGFYGKSVTYQLTVSKFNGSFNANNGNFEAVVDFIGYNYSLLTDIHFQYLTAAPYDTYYGQQYFNEHKTTTEWLLDDEVEPITLLDLNDKIKAGIPKIQEMLNTNPIAIQNTIVSGEIESLENIKNAYNRMIMSFDKNHQRLIYNKSQIVYALDSEQNEEFTSEYIKCQNEFVSLINSYNENARYKDRVFNSDVMPNRNMNKLSIGDYFRASQAFTITKDANNKVTIVPYTSTVGLTDFNVLKKRKFNDGKMLNFDIVIELINMINKNNKSLFKQCIYIFDINNFDEALNNRIEKCKNKIETQKREVDLFVKKALKQTIGFTPSIYNISKLIFIHLETFLASIFNCSSSIFTLMKNGGRSLSSYNIDVSDTDINYIDSNDKSLPPFPLILNKGHKTNYSGNGDNNLPVYGWIGDLRFDAPEKLLIEGYVKAVEKQTEEIDRNRREMENNGIIQNLIPLFPNDLVVNKSPFSYRFIQNKVMDEFIAHIGVRSVNLFGFLFNQNTDLDLLKFAKQAGEIDAYNFYFKGMSKDEIKNEILTKIGSGRKAVDNITGILSCSNDDFATFNQNTKSNSYNFELLKGVPHYSPQRNPIIKKEGNNYKYTYMYINKTDNDNAANDLFMMPVNIFNSEDLALNFTSNNMEKKPFNFPSLNVNYENDFCITLSDKDVETIYDKKTYNQYKNKFILNIYYGDDMTRIVDSYDKLKNGQVSVRDYETSSDFSEIVKLLWKIEASDYQLYYDCYPNINGKPTTLSVPYDESKPNGVEDNSMLSGGLLKEKIVGNEGKENKLLPTTLDDNVKIVNEQWNFRDWYSVDWKISEKMVMVNTVEKKEKGIENYSILEIPIFENDVVNSLFGHPFYYLQNIRFSRENDINFNYRSIRAKALLFLHCLPINYCLIDLDANLKNGYINRMPKALVLFIGGILWRNEYVNSYIDSPIIEDVFNYTDNINVTYQHPVGRTNINTPITQKLLFGRNGKRVNICPRVFGKIGDCGIDCKVYFNYDIFSIRRSIKNMLIKEFEEWAVNSSDGFKSIMDNYELLFVKDGSTMAMTPENLKFVSGIWSNEYGNGTKKIDKESLKKYICYFGNNFLKNYSSFYSGMNKNNLRLLIRDDTKGEELLKSIYSESCLFCLSTYASNDTNTLNGINIKNTYIEKYIDSLIETLNKIVNKNSETSNDNDPSDIDMQRDINIAMYTYLKNIYDKWLTGETLESYTVKNFFDENFIFVDSFYRNIGDDLIVSCDYFSQIYDTSPDKFVLFSFLADLYAKHGMIFTPTSNFNDWAKQDVLDDMFKPLPFNSMNPMERENKFICMYMHEPSKNLNIGQDNSSYGYKYDGFDIYDEENPDNIDIQPKVFKSDQQTNNDTKYAYPIPAFGVAFGKANQSYFTNVSVNMNNPVTSEYSIKAIWDIAQLGKGSSTKVQFVGQDLFSVWSNYSYTCEVEMLGCAQIQPLMYFQLLNIPMFKGTYVITKVSHTLTPGNMKTKFTGVKLSKYGQPFNSKPFAMLGVLTKNATAANMLILNGGLIDNTEYNTPHSEYKFYSPEDIIISSDDCGCGNGSGWEKLSPIMKKLFYAIRETIENIDGNENGKKWTICVSSGYRPNSKVGSDHLLGNAMDIQIKKNGVQIVGGQDKNELGIVFDIIVSSYYPYIKQLIMEYRDSTSMQQNFNLFNTIHFASLGKNATPKPTIYQSDSAAGNDVRRMYEYDKFSVSEKAINNNKTSETLNKSNSAYLEKVKKAQDSLSFISPYYKKTAKKKLYAYLPNNIDKFKNIFTSFRKVDNDTLKYYFELNDNTLYGISHLSGNKSTHGYTSQPRCPNVDEFIKKINEISQQRGFNPNWLMIVMASESGLDPSAYNNKSRATGLIQFMPSYYEEKWNTTSDRLRSMNATEQLVYVDKYFSQWSNAKYKYPADMYLVALAPAVLSFNDRNASSVVYSSDSVNHRSIIPLSTLPADKSLAYYNGNKAFDTDNKGYITIQDVQNRFMKKAYEFAKSNDDKTQLDYILSSSIYK